MSEGVRSFTGGEPVPPEPEKPPRLVWVVETSDGGTYLYPVDEYRKEENQIGVLFYPNDRPLNTSMFASEIDFTGFFTFYPWDNIVRFSGTSKDKL